MVFVKHFDLLVSDPQCEGMGQGEYDAAKLVRGWNFETRVPSASS